MSKIDNATWEPLPITMMGDYSSDFFTIPEREKLEAVVLADDVSVAGPNLPTRICKNRKTHIDHMATETLADEKSFVFDSR